MSKSNSIIGKYSENKNSISIHIKKVNLNYVDQFIQLKCSPDILGLRVFPNTKEITESMAAYNAVRKYMRNELHNSKINCFVVGDGSTPRTASLFSFLTSWRVYSIDPMLTEDKLVEWESKVNSLSCHKQKIEKFVKNVPPLDPKAPKILVAVHSHAPLGILWSYLRSAYRKSRLLVVAIPCCVEQSLGITSTKNYYDWGICSPKRLVEIWDIKEPDRLQED